MNRIVGGDGMQELEGKHCLICQTLVEPSVLSFWSVVICNECEGEIMELTVDQSRYDEVVKAFRLLWQCRLASSKYQTTMESENI